MIRNSLAVAWKDLLIVLKDKGALAVYFLMPLLFASLLGMAFGNTGSDCTDSYLGNELDRDLYSGVAALQVIY